MVIKLNNIPVMCAVSDNGPIGAADAFKKIEDALEWRLKGRKFYGVMDKGVYRACVATTILDDPQKLGLEIYTIPGGNYLREKINNWEKHTNEIKLAFEKLIKDAGNKLDKSRPNVEFYRSQKELFLLVPVS